MTARRVVSTRRADEDIVRALEGYLEAEAREAASDLIQALQNARDLLSMHPSLGSARHAAETGILELRSLALRRFPFILFYTDDADAVRIHRVLHSSRDLPAELTGD
ncbi:type II toxin-antitoxin system RelE/ParE family toxin [Cnuibacter physcomitrellae]|uniref:type II toxin-antitoxin system RelE/ParE family toxin n=1 Tax=Cnuibacter physcomitrellae TaxID=1619308 RepID=UPI002175BDA0|nr:type II toxin-antitoxin system RelE/ParE family toxin [Cnuibacter physcomitrellae]MCS5498385.1 type II toxin-antitoxin system RelE/ParE family toxin [Cnuibacter physcomitrellae]